MHWGVSSGVVLDVQGWYRWEVSVFTELDAALSSEYLGTEMQGGCNTNIQTNHQARGMQRLVPRGRSQVANVQPPCSTVFDSTI